MIAPFSALAAGWPGSPPAHSRIVASAWAPAKPRLFPLSAFARVMESLLVMKVDHDETKKIARQEKGAELRILS